MTNDVVILIADDDPGHIRLIEKNLSRAGLHNSIQKFEDGQQVLDFFFGKGKGPRRKRDVSYLLLLDIRMPKVDGIEVLRQLKEDKALRRIPVHATAMQQEPPRCPGRGRTRGKRLRNRSI